MKVDEKMIEAVWREGFQAARECLTEDEAFTLTMDVEEDCWRDSRARSAMLSAAPTDYGELVARLRAPAFWCCESDEGHPGDATTLVHEAADAIELLSARGSR